jgi:hypothetical protein
MSLRRVRDIDFCSREGPESMGLIGIEDYFQGDFCLYCRESVTWYG